MSETLYMRERDRETETETETDRQTDRDRERERERERTKTLTYGCMKSSNMTCPEFGVLCFNNPETAKI